MVVKEVGFESRFEIGKDFLELCSGCQLRDCSIKSVQQQFSST